MTAEHPGWLLASPLPQGLGWRGQEAAPTAAIGKLRLPAALPGQAKVPGEEGVKRELKDQHPSCSPNGHK